MQNNCAMQKSILLIFVLVLFPYFGVATSIITTAPGGDPATGYQPNQIIFVNGNKIRGHTMFKNGFSIPAGASAVTWDGDGIVDGQIQFLSNTATLVLSSDLRLGSTATVYNPTVSGPVARINGGNKKIILGGNLTLPYSLTISTGNLTIDGQDHVLTLSNTTRYSAAISSTGGPNVTLKNMTLVIDSAGVSGFKVFSGNTNSLILENVVIRCVPYPSRPVGLMNAYQGVIAIKGRVSLESPGGLISLITGSGFSTVSIDKNSTLCLGKNTAFALAISGASAASITMVDKTSCLHFDGCDFYTSTYASPNLFPLTLTNGTVLFENKVRIFNDYYGGSGSNTDMSDAFILGSALSACVLSDAYVTVDGCMRYEP